jgi:hypothetical protein
MSRPKGPFFRHSVMILAVSEEKWYFSSMNKRYCRECTVKRPENDPLTVLSLLEIVSTENFFLCGRFKYQSGTAYALFRCRMCMLPEIVYLHHVFSPIIMAARNEKGNVSTSAFFTLHPFYTCLCKRLSIIKDCAFGGIEAGSRD